MANYLRITNYDVIISYIKYNSNLLYTKVKLNNNLILYRKYLTHSDIVTLGKSIRRELIEPSNFILYYDSINELRKKSKHYIGKQSSINLPKQFYPDVEIYNKDEKIPYREDITKHYNCYIPNDIVRDFNLSDFNNIVTKLGKRVYNSKIASQIKINYSDNLSSDDFYKIKSLTVTKHGVGTSKDVFFHNLRKIIFKGDVLNFLILQESKELYIFPERNEEYYKVLSGNKTKYVDMPLFSDYEKKYKKKFSQYLVNLEELERLEGNNANDYVIQNESQYMFELRKKIKKYELNGLFPQYRWYQEKWKEVIIKSFALQVDDNSVLRCAISSVTAINISLSYLFIASHIKEYSKCVEEGNWDEAFDPNNGLILVSNVDKLFDRHDITINASNSEIIISDVAKQIIAYKRILPNDKLSLFYFNNYRKSYLEYHNKCFRAKHGNKYFK